MKIGTIPILAILIFVPTIAISKCLHPDFQNRWLFMKKSATDSTSTETIREISTRSSTACVQECLGNAYCVGVIYNRNSMKCHLQTRSNSAAVVKLETDSVFYDVQFENSVRKIHPASCSEIKKCSTSSTDGEFWVFPDTYDRQTAIKTYCEGMTSPETASEYITLHYDNYSIRRDLNHGSRCYTKNTKNLMRTTFSKVKINVESMVIENEDFKFASTTGISDMTEIPFGVSYDCTGESWWEKRWGPCKLYGRFQLDIRGTGLAISESVGWIADGWRGEIRDFTRSSDSTEVSCLVIGWPAKCTPNSTMNVEPLNPQEVSGTAQTVICA